MVGNLNRLLSAPFVLAFAEATQTEVTTRMGDLWFNNAEFSVHLIPFASTQNVRARFVVPAAGLYASPDRLAVLLGLDAPDRSMPDGVDSDDAIAVSAARTLRVFEHFVYPHCPGLHQRFPEVFSPLETPSDLPAYVELRISEDPAVMGVDHPQINGVDGGDGAALREADHIALDDLLMKVAATHTDFVSCSFLAHRGIIMSPSGAELLLAQRVACGPPHPFTANRRYPEHARQLVHIPIEEHDLIDWSHSRFSIRRPNEPAKPVAFGCLDEYQAAVWESAERAEAGRIEPAMIRLADYVDLFRFPARGTLVASRRVVQLVTSHKLTGSSFRSLSFNIT